MFNSNFYKNNKIFTKKESGVIKTDGELPLGNSFNFFDQEMLPRIMSQNKIKPIKNEEG